MNLVNSNKDMNEFIRIIVLLEISDALIDGVSETVKHEIKQQEGGCLGLLFGSLVASIIIKKRGHESWKRSSKSSKTSCKS